MSVIGSFKIEAFSPSSATIVRVKNNNDNNKERKKKRKKIPWLLAGKTSFWDEATRKGLLSYLEVLCVMISFYATLSNISLVAAAELVNE